MDAAVVSGHRAVDRYLAEGFEAVPGMSSRFATAICGHVVRRQTELGVSGSIAEIGTFEGRFFIGLALALAEGERAYGFDCFVFPARYLADLDLGSCCIGSGHFDYLLYMALDAVSGFRVARVGDIPLTFHIGNAIEWVRNIDYVEHNLGECLAAIGRMRARFDVPPGSDFAGMERRHFLPNARLSSALLRKLKRVPGVGAAAYHVKKWIGRSH